MIKALPIKRKDGQGTNYSLDGFILCTRPKESISGDHSDNDREELRLLSGTIEVTIGDETTTVDTPSYIYVPPGQCRKIVAKTDSVQFLFKKWPA